ncbi:MAG: hypothetical protein RJA81_2396 [Planctomycetota bacterium]
MKEGPWLQMADYSPYQQKVIGRYYDNFEGIKLQRLSELATEIYLAEGKKQDRLWKQVSEILIALKLPQTRIDHVMSQKNPALIPELVSELSRKLAK